MTQLRADLEAIAWLIRPKERVLDLGCGDGELLYYLKTSYRVKGRGIELSESGMLACVQKGLSVRQGNLEEGLSDYPDASFDTVILSQTLHYLDNPAFIVREMLRVGQRAIISFPNWGYWRARLAFLFTGRMPVVPDLPEPWGSTPRPRFVTISDFGSFCKSQGFTVANQIYFAGTTRIPNRIDKNLRATSAVFELRSTDKEVSHIHGVR